MLQFQTLRVVLIKSAKIVIRMINLETLKVVYDNLPCLGVLNSKFLHEKSLNSKYPRLFNKSQNPLPLAANLLIFNTTFLSSQHQKYVKHLFLLFLYSSLNLIFIFFFSLNTQTFFPLSLPPFFFKEHNTIQSQTKIKNKIKSKHMQTQNQNHNRTWTKEKHNLLCRRSMVLCGLAIVCLGLAWHWSKRFRKTGWILLSIDNSNL